MAVSGKFARNQLRGIVQGEALASSQNGGDSDMVRTIERKTKYRAVPWIIAMEAACKDARGTWEIQHLAEGDWQEENADVRVGVSATGAWRRSIDDAFTFAVTVPETAKAAKRAKARWDRVNIATDSYEDERALVPLLVATLRRFDLTMLDLTEADLQRGLALTTEMAQDRSDADKAKGGRATATRALVVAIRRIAELAEQYVSARNLAVSRLIIDEEAEDEDVLPSIDLTYIRAAAAAHGDPEDDDEEPTEGGEGGGAAGEAGPRGL
jgi:hypothetical protein